MPAAPLPENEHKRLQALRCTGILDTLPEDSFEHIVDLAKTLFNCPVALVSMIDEDRQWFKAKRGFDDVEGPRDVAFCAHAILQDESLWVEDARQDARFADNPQVTGAPHLRFYAGAPIVLACGARVGTVAVVDLAPRTFDPVLAKNLQALADLAADQLRSRTVMQTLDDTNRQLTMEQAKTVSTLTAMTEGVIVQNAKGQITFCNPAAEQILGLSRDQLRGLTSTDPRWRAIHEDGRDFPGSTHPATMALKTGMRQRNVTMGIELPSGERRWLLVNAEPIFDYIVKTEPSRVVATFTDITEARETRRHLIEAKKLAEAADQAKSEFLANMSHELRTPMNGVVSMANALLETDLSDRQREMVDIIVRSGGSLERLLSEILDLSKIQSEQFELRPEPTEIHHLIQDLTELYGARAEEKGLCVKTSVAENVSGTFETDPVRLRQMMANLLANAIKFTETGCVCVEASLETLKGQEALRFAVKDTGIGFASKSARICSNASPRPTARSRAGTAARVSGSQLPRPYVTAWAVILMCNPKSIRAAPLPWSFLSTA